MKHAHTLLFMAALLVCAGVPVRAVADLQDSVTTVPAADVSVEQTSTAPVDLLFSTAEAEDSGATNDLHTKAHLSDAAGAPHHRTTLDDEDGTVATNSTPSGHQISVPHVPEPSSQTGVYVLGGTVGLGFVVMRRRRRSLV